MNYSTRVNTIEALAQQFQVKKEPENIVEINSLWISVKERVPTEEEIKRHQGKFLVCRADGTIFIDDYKVISQRSGIGMWVVIESTPVIAWMNLPDPYAEVPE